MECDSWFPYEFFSLFCVLGVVVIHHSTPGWTSQKQNPWNGAHASPARSNCDILMPSRTDCGLLGAHACIRPRRVKPPKTLSAG